MPDVDEQLFVCPECDEHIEVNASMQDALVEHGCVICGATVSETDFDLSD